MKPERANPGFLAAFREIVLRMQRSLADVRSSLREPLRIYVAGGAAVHLYTGARVTEDIDATLSRRMLLPANLEVAFQDVDGTVRVLYWDRQYNDTQGLLHEDAYQDSLPLEIDGLDLSLVDVRVLSPVDLAVSKLARFGEDDRSDIKGLAECGLLDARVVRQRAEEALDAYIGQKDMVKIALDECCSMIGDATLRRRKPGRKRSV